MTAMNLAPEPRLRIHTRERRFLPKDPVGVEAVLWRRGAPVEYVRGEPESRVTTVYFDTAEGTWSRGRSATKFRCKNYGNGSNWWFELKRRVGVVVDKWRRPVTPEQLKALLDGRRTEALKRYVGEQPLLPLAVVCYRRLAFEWTGLRVTLDRDVRFHAPEGLAAGRLLGELGRVVVEVKREGALPRWLSQPLARSRVKGFSKSRRALALLWDAAAPADGNGCGIRAS